MFCIVSFKRRVLTSTFFLKAEITCLHNIYVSNMFLALACITYLRLDLNEPSLSLVAYFRLHNHSFLGGHFETFYRNTKFDKFFFLLILAQNLLVEVTSSPCILSQKSYYQSLSLFISNTNEILCTLIKSWLFSIS